MSIFATIVYRDEVDLPISDGHCCYGGHSVSLKVPETGLDVATVVAKDLGSCGCGGVGPFIGSKRSPAL